jgi:hypothetical protein
MDILSVITLVYLTIIGAVFVVLGSNTQSRLFGLVTVFLAIANGLKLDGLI